MNSIFEQSNFFKEAEQLISKTMGTEHMSPLLYSLVKFIRPHRCLEIGGGLTTIYILAALRELYELEKEEMSNKETNFDLSLKNKDYYNLPHHDFILHSFDMLNHPETSANKILEISKKLELDQYLKFYNNDYKNLVELIPKEEQEFDFIWCDLGGLEHYLAYQNLLFPMISEKNGGYIVFHSTLSNVHGLAFLSQLKLKINNGSLPDFELISFFEPQKMRQNSCTIIRKARGLSNHIYTERP
tara:strand:+ start:486 stop:1214 length:729 start_codon:yes stop_codon:yes gene_type:complete